MGTSANLGVEPTSSPDVPAILVNLPSAGVSAVAGGLVFMSCARSVKKATASIRFTFSRTAVFMSMEGSTVPTGGVYALP
jgi:hypothetical protein